MDPLRCALIFFTLQTLLCLAQTKPVLDESPSPPIPIASKPDSIVKVSDTSPVTVADQNSGRIAAPEVSSSIGDTDPGKFNAEPKAISKPAASAALVPEATNDSKSPELTLSPKDNFKHPTDVKTRGYGRRLRIEDKGLSARVRAQKLFSQTGVIGNAALNGALNNPQKVAEGHSPASVRQLKTYASVLPPDVSMAIEDSMRSMSAKSVSTQAMPLSHVTSKETAQPSLGLTSINIKSSEITPNPKSSDGVVNETPSGGIPLSPVIAPPVETHVPKQPIFSETSAPQVSNTVATPAATSVASLAAPAEVQPASSLAASSSSGDTQAKDIIQSAPNPLKLSSANLPPTVAASEYVPFPKHSSFPGDVQALNSPSRSIAPSDLISSSQSANSRSTLATSENTSSTKSSVSGDFQAPSTFASGQVVMIKAQQPFGSKVADILPNPSESFPAPINFPATQFSLTPLIPVDIPANPTSSIIPPVEISVSKSPQNLHPINAPATNPSPSIVAPAEISSTKSPQSLVSADLPASKPDSTINPVPDSNPPSNLPASTKVSAAGSPENLVPASIPPPSVSKDTPVAQPAQSSDIAMVVPYLVSSLPLDVPEKFPSSGSSGDSLVKTLITKFSPVVDNSGTTSAKSESNSAPTGFPDVGAIQNTPVKHVSLASANIKTPQTRKPKVNAAPPFAPAVSSFHPVLPFGHGGRLSSNADDKIPWKEFDFPLESDLNEPQTRSKQHQASHNKSPPFKLVSAHSSLTPEKLAYLATILAPQNTDSSSSSVVETGRHSRPNFQTPPRQSRPHHNYFSSSQNRQKDENLQEPAMKSIKMRVNRPKSHLQLSSDESEEPVQRHHSRHSNHKSYKAKIAELERQLRLKNVEIENLKNQQQQPSDYDSFNYNQRGRNNYDGVF